MLPETLMAFSSELEEVNSSLSMVSSVLISLTAEYEALWLVLSCWDWAASEVELLVGLIRKNQMIPRVAMRVMIVEA